MKIKCSVSITQIFQNKQAHLTCFERWMNTINSIYIFSLDNCYLKILFEVIAVLTL